MWSILIYSGGIWLDCGCVMCIGKSGQSMGLNPDKSKGIHVESYESCTQWYDTTGKCNKPWVFASASYPLDRNGSRPTQVACVTTSPHVQKWSSEAILFI